MNDTTIIEARDVKQVSPSPNTNQNTAVELLIQQNSVLMGQMAIMQQQMAQQYELPLRAALARKRLRVIGQVPAIGKDLLVQFRGGTEYTTTDTNVVKDVLKSLMDANGLSYQVTPHSHKVKEQQSYGYYHEVSLQFMVTDVDTGYSEIVPGDWLGIFIGSLDKGYSAAITNGTGKFLISYFNISSFDRPEEPAFDVNGNPVAIKEKKPATTNQRQQTTPSTDKQPTKAELDYQKAKAVFSALKTSDAVKDKWEAFTKLPEKPFETASFKRAYIERYYQLVDLDLSDENQNKFIVENWKGKLYNPSGKISHYRIYVLDAEIAIRDENTAKNLKTLAQFKEEK